MTKTSKKENTNLRSTVAEAKRVYHQSILKNVPSTFLELADKMYDHSENFAKKYSVEIPQIAVLELGDCPVPELISSQLSASFQSSQAKALAFCFSLVLGENVPSPKGRSGTGTIVSKLSRGLALVPTYNSGHNYPLLQVAVSFSTSRTALIRIDGTPGNNLSSDAQNYRIATKSEILGWLIEISICRNDLLVELATTFKIKL